jgi:hypothetical protein
VSMGRSPSTISLYSVVKSQSVNASTCTPSRAHATFEAGWLNEDDAMPLRCTS